MIAIDLRGHGRSTNPTGKITHRQMALDTFALMGLLGIDRFKALGLSSGAMTLIHMATQQPERLEAIPRSYLWVIPNWGHAPPDAHSGKLMALFIESALGCLAGDWESE